MSIAIVYGSSTGNTQSAAELIAESFGTDMDIIDVASTDAGSLNGYEKLILGSSTWGEGEFQDDWDAFDWGEADFSGKTVALFGLGDQEGYSSEYCNAMKLLYDEAKKAGANIVGSWENEGYDFEDSEAIGDDGKFVGLALDSDNQDDLTNERVQKWVEQIKPDFA